MSRRIVPFETMVLVAAMLAGGCASPPPTVAGPATSTRYAPPADRFVRSVLLDFETPTDAAFVDARGATPATDPTTPGNRALRVGDATIRLGALLRGRPFPAAWDLIGVRVLAATATRVTATLDDAGIARGSAGATLMPDVWQTLWIETATLTATRPASGPTSDGLTLAIHADAGGDVLIDDVALAQGRTVVADSTRDGERFHVERCGLSWRATLGDRALCTLPAAPFAADGYRVVEANAARAAFANAAGDVVCIDRAGRVLRGNAAPPASVDAIDGTARLVRNAPGDRDNDGYDESRGCFTIRASGDRFTVRLDPVANAPADGVIVFDLDGLRADGVASVWVQGELIGATTRTTAADGATRTIVELPMRIERPVDVCVRVR